MTGPAVVRNPVIPGFNPDPSIIRVDGDFYLATSTFEWLPAVQLFFEWLPAVQLFHSTNLADWTLIGHALTGDRAPDLRGIHPSGGVWAPSLSHDPATGLFHLVYSVMRNQTGEQFDVSNYLVTAPDIRGPWSEPAYLNSVGFDASLFHDDDGRKWLVTLEWDPREGYEHPGAIVLEEYDPAARSLVGPARRISRGATDRGCLEAPNLYKRDGFYYLMTAEGGTGFGHCVALARSRTIDGPYQPAPAGPVFSSHPDRFFARNDRDFLRPHLFDPRADLHKAGHGSLVQTAAGEWYVAHLSARPLPGTLRSVLGRETSLQKVRWTADGWLELTAGGSLAGSCTEAPADLAAPAGPATPPTVFDDFDGPTLDVNLATLRHSARPDWADLSARPGWLRLHGRDSLFSRFDISLVAARLQAFTANAETLVDFTPRHFSHAAGLTVFYDDANWFYLRIYHSESLGGRAIGILEADVGERREHVLDRVPLPDGPIVLRAALDHGSLQFSWHTPGTAPHRIGPVLNASRLADEPVRGFTGTMIGITCQDAARRTAYADFDHLRLDNTVRPPDESATPAGSRARFTTTSETPVAR
jgi:xylan 1,4-beta-xylosidase